MVSSNFESDFFVSLITNSIYFFNALSSSAIGMFVSLSKLPFRRLISLTILYETFLKYNGYMVNAFTDPFNALYSFKKDVYDLALLDLKMPKMNGIELSQELQNIDPNLFYRFITAANKEDIENIKANNPDIEKIIIYKPLWLNQLRSKVHSLLSNQQQKKKR
ncbi:MAG TPA: response regulator [Nitrososphaeraceae archaeon]